MTDSLRSQIIDVADRHADRTEDDILALLEYEWERAGLALADRGPREYLREVRDDLVRRAIGERETVAVITALVADDALHWAAAHHLASERYAFVIGLLVAWTTKAALRPRTGSDGSDAGRNAIGESDDNTEHD